MPPSAPLVDTLEADRGVTCVVGAGGKKSTLYALANQLERAVVTATVRIPPFEEHVSTVRITDSPQDALERTEDWPLGLVAADEGDRYRGYEPSVIDDLAAQVDVPILVKADGARTRWLKAPNEREPQLPTSATTVVPIASVRAVGEVLDDRVVHRPEEVAAITGLEIGEHTRVEDVATILTSPDGGLKRVPDGATVIPLLNMADTPDLVATAREIGDLVCQHEAVSRVVITRLLEEEPVIDVLE
ncbi:selenium cofactor biosynthesis protein YqeC [Natrialbaceae archaeon A-CW1-1]